MAVPPKFTGQRIVFSDSDLPTDAVRPARHVIEVFLDYCCPFSARMFKTLQSTVGPMIGANPEWTKSVELIFRQQIQPWHPSSTLMHEAALAVLRLYPKKFWNYSSELFEHQSEFFDVNVVAETRNQTYERLAKLAGGVPEVNEAEVLKLLRISDKPGADGSLNAGNQVTADVKLITKMHRLVGIHVTPTVLFDGVVQGNVSSAWTGDQWKDFLANNVI